MPDRSDNCFTGLILSIVFLFCMIFIPSLANADSMLENGPVVNSKMKSLAANTEIPSWKETDHIKAIYMADALPTDFVPSEANTVSTNNSQSPIYIFFDNENDAGIIYFYTKDKRIIANPDSSYLFASNKNLTDVSGVAEWDLSSAVYLNGIFMNDASLSNISALSSWDVHNVSMMTQMFFYNTSLCEISAMSHWETSSVTDMYGMFAGTKNLTDALALRNWNTSNVTNMGYMFAGANSLVAIDVSNWDTSKVTNMESMFQVGDSHVGNGQLREILGLDNLNVSNVTDMTCMFYGAAQMTFYDIAGWDVSKVVSMNHMFCDNFSLRLLDLSRWDVSNVKTMYCMFDDNYKLKTIGDVSRWNTSSLIDVGSWLNGATSFIGDNSGTLDLSGWDTSNLKAAGEMFRATQLHTIDLSGWTFDSITNDLWEDAGKGIYYETCNGFEAYKGLGEMFKSTSQLETVYVSQSGMDSFNRVVEEGVNTLNMWNGSKCAEFTVK